MKKLMARKLAPSAAGQPTAESDKICEEQQLQPDTTLKQRDYQGNTCVHIAAKHGRHELIGFLTTLSAPWELFRQTNDKGDTVLHTAAKSGHLSVSDLLIRYGQEARVLYMGKENGKGNLPLHEALLHNHQHVVDLLFHWGACYSFYLNKERKSPFYLCLEAGNIKTFNAMLKADTWTSTHFDYIIETQFMEGKSVLHTAISRKDKVMLQGILAKGMHMLLHVKDENGQSPIELASTVGFNEGQNMLSLELRKDITTGDLCVNEQVFEQSPDILCTPLAKKEQEDGEGVEQTPDWDGIHERMGKLLRSVMVSQQLQGMLQHCMDFGLYEAAKIGNVDEFISALEQYSVENNLALTSIFGQITPLKNTFLHVASRYGHKDLTWLIMCYFPSLLDRVNCHGNTALHLAARERNLGVVEILVKLKKGKLRNELQQSITNVAMSGMKEDMQMMIAENDEGRTPLQLAQRNYNNVVVDFLIKEHVEVAYHVNKEGTSLLYIVIINGHTEQLNKIFSTVSHNVDKKILDDQLTKGKSLILAAIRSWEIEKLQELARQKPMLFNIKYEHAQKLVHFAELFGFHEAANYLRSEFKLEIVLDNTIAAVIPNFPLHPYSLDAYSLSIIESVDPKIENIRQLMHRKGRNERMRKLICNRSLQYMPSEDLVTPMDIKLYEAAKKGDVDSFIGALENISQENSSYLRTILQQRTHIGNTFLHVAAIHGNEDFTGFIVFYFRNVLREKNKKGNTATHEAARAGHLGVLEILVKVDKYHHQLYTAKEYDIGWPPTESRVTHWMCTSAGNTSILEAFVNNQRKVIDYLIKSSVKEACHVNKEGKSGLYFAVEAGMVDAVKTISSSITADDNLKYICELTNGKSLINAATRRRSA
ncbi:ankyrin repeat-containing protein, partial [Tanacetum coccineum]